MTDTCTYCGKPFDPAFYGTRKTKDHIVPRSFNMSGGHIRDGVVSACGSCNSLKADMLPNAMRQMAAEHRKRAEALDSIAARVEDLINERGLLP